MATQFVGDYRTKSRLAEALRGRAQALGSLGSNMPTTISTPGFANAPPMVQANWAAPIATLAGAYFGGKKQEEAEAMEKEAQAARQQALQSIMEGGEFGPQQAIMMSDLGYDTGSLSNYLPKQEKQLGYFDYLKEGVPSALALKMGKGEELTPEEHELVTAHMSKGGKDGGKVAIGAILQAIQSGKVHPEFAIAISEGREITPELMDLQLNYGAQMEEEDKPKTPSELLAAKQAELVEAVRAGDTEKAEQLKKELDMLARSKQVGGFDEEDTSGWMNWRGKLVRPIDPKDKELTKRSMEFQSNAMEAAEKAFQYRELFELTNRPELYSDKNKLAAALDRFSTTSDGIVGTVTKMLADSLKSPEAVLLTRGTLQAILADMKKLGGNDTDREFQRIEQQYPNVYTDPKAARAVLADLARTAQRLAVSNTISDYNFRSQQEMPPYEVNKLAHRILSGEKVEGMEALGDVTYAIPDPTTFMVGGAQGGAPSKPSMSREEFIEKFNARANQ